MFERERLDTPYSGPEKETILSDDTKFKGSLEFSHKLIINGRFEGNLNSSGILCIGTTGEVKAEIHVGSIIVEGKVWGNITAEDKIELRSSAELHGDITAKRLVINEGALFIGKSDVNPNRKETVAHTPAAAAHTEKKKEQVLAGAGSEKKESLDREPAKDKNSKQQLLETFNR